MSDKETLRAKARAVVAKGELPNRQPDRTRRGPGVGAGCAICDLPVTGQEKELEIEFVQDGDTPGRDKYHVHIRCFAAWEFARRQPAG